jgi:hypothetical protein
MFTTKFSIVTLVLAFAVGCGTEPVPVAADDGTVKGGDIDREPAERETVVEYRKDGAQIALALESTRDLPACELANERQLAWIKSTQQFFACERETWVEVPVKGRDGADGEDGAIGPAGEPGEDGEPGPQGPPASANQWHDPMTGRTWLVGASVTQQAILLGGYPCSGSYRAPTSAELQTAILHGLSIASQAFGGPATFWSSDTVAEPLHGDQVPVFVSQAGIAAMSAGAPAGIACLFEGE